MILFSGAFWEGWSGTIDAMQIGALILLAISVAIPYGIRRRWRRSGHWPWCMSALLFALALPAGASAADAVRGRNRLIAAGGEVEHANDLIVAALQVKIDGTVDGDLTQVHEEPHSDRARDGRCAIGVAGEIVIDGNVDGNVRVFSHSVNLAGAIGKNVTAFANSVDLASKANVGGGMIVFAGDADLDGKMAATCSGG